MLESTLASTGRSVSRAGSGSFLGRTQELELIRQLLVGGTARLLTLTGPAGVGKTRLAHEVAIRFGAAFPDGVWFVDLAPIRDPVEVPSAVARSLGLPDTGPVSLIEALSAYLRGRDTLLIMDNFEQVLPAAPLLDSLLAQAPGLKLLITSRELMHLHAEQILPVSPLTLPDLDHLPPLGQLAKFASVALFLERAQMINPGVRLTDENARTVAELVVRLDGLPLAIELAAARTRLLSPQMLLERLEHRLSLLHWEAQDLPERQHTLRTDIAWSYELLSPEEQPLFRSLGVFVGGFTLEAAEAVVSDERDHTIDVLEGLASLVDKSLVQSEEDGEGAYRFRLLQSVREFALEQVTSCCEGEAVGRAHSRYFLELAGRAAPELVGPRQREWFLRLEREHGNMRAALRWLRDHDGNELVLRLAAALGYFWEVRGYLQEGRQALEEALARVRDADARLRARVLSRLGSILLWQGETEHARVVLEESLALGRALGDADITARSLSQLGRRAAGLGSPDESVQEAVRLLEEAMTLRQQMEDRRGAASIQTQLALISLGQREYERAQQLAQASLAMLREVGDEAGATVPMVLLGMAAAEQGDIAHAVAPLRQGLETSRRLQDRRLLQFVSNMVLWWLGEEQGDAEQLTVLLGAAEAMAETMESMPFGLWKARTPKVAAALQGRLGTERFEAARREGRSQSFSQIGELISLLLDAIEASSSGAEESNRKRPRRILLSKREAEVLRLVAEGLTNKEIARQLIVSENTVKTHVTSLFIKLHVDSRARAVAVAANEGLLDGVAGTTSADD